MFKGLRQSNKYHVVKQENLMSEFGAKKLEKQIFGVDFFIDYQTYGTLAWCLHQTEIEVQTIHKYLSC